MEAKGFLTFEIIINALVSSSVSFEYLCYGSTEITNVLFSQCRDGLYTSKSDVYGCHIMMS